VKTKIKHTQEEFFMQTQDLTEPEVPQVPPYDREQMAQGLAEQLAVFLFPLLVTLDQLLDKRLVRTFRHTIQVIIADRDRVGGLRLSEWGGYLLSRDKAPAGPKRLSNLWHSSKWTAKAVEDDLWQRADQQGQTWQEQGEGAVVIWESREWEKPESLASEGLCAVRSSKARRLTPIKAGYYHPPGRRIFVPGMHWLAAVVGGRSAQRGPALLAAMRWWSSRRANASFTRDEEGKLLVERLLGWGRAVAHIFDQGCAGAFWLGVVLAFGLRFVLGWRGAYQLCDAQGNRRKAWRLAFGKRGWSERTNWDSRRPQWVHGSVLALPVTHPAYRDTPLWLGVCRRKGRPPWYLLTAEPITTDEDVWRVVCAYARRWQSELSWRFDKSQLAFQRPRLWPWQERAKWLAMATLA
jgi:hypothetical protein